MTPDEMLLCAIEVRAAALRLLEKNSICKAASHARRIALWQTRRKWGEEWAPVGFWDAYERSWTNVGAHTKQIHDDVEDLADGAMKAADILETTARDEARKFEQMNLEGGWR